MRLKWILVLLVAGGAALLVTFRAEVAMWTMGRVIERNLAQNAVTELPDGLHLAVCGAGAPLADADRSGPCLAVIAGGRLFVVDAGSGGARNLQRMGFNAGAVEAVFLTHFHSDHIDGLGELAMLRWTGAAHTAPLPVHGPAGVERVVAGFNQAYALDAGYRTAHHGAGVAPPAGAGAAAVAFEAPENDARVTVWEGDGITVSAFPVPHDPVAPAVGYRFDYGGRSLVISGDTRYHPPIAEHAAGADLLAHEALAPQLVGLINRAATATGRTGIARITADILDYHTTPEEAARLAAAAGVDHLLLYHIVPPLPLPGLDKAFLEGVAETYGGGVTLSRDGTFVSLPAGGSTIELGNRL
ncbi:MAG: MBL fold metallo-hydrolase [Gammaproteobacteria bacterium]|nr:MBL fold metallo-hydrolase [Gammaproteobacteria bacterium]